MRGAGGTMTSSAPVDLADESAVHGWIDGAAAEHGGVDVLYNNAGLTSFAPLEQVTLDDWSFTMRNELDLVFLACKHAWPHLRARGGGSVVNVGSTAGMTGSLTLDRTAHTASKGAVIALTRQLAAEGARHGIRVNSVSPGMTVTPQTQHLFDDPEHPIARIADHIPLGRPGRPEDVAQLRALPRERRVLVRHRREPRRRRGLVDRFFPATGRAGDSAGEPGRARHAPRLGARRRSRLG